MYQILNESSENVIGISMGYPWLDTVLAFPVTLAGFWSGLSVLKEHFPRLRDRTAITPEAIHAITMQVPGVFNCHTIRSRGVLGRQVLIEMHLVVLAEDVETAVHIKKAVEVRLQRRYHPVQVRIQVEPPAYPSA